MKLSRHQLFQSRPENLKDFNGDYPELPGVNGKEWKKRKNLFYNSMLKGTDSKYMTSHVQNNVKNKIVCPSIDKAIIENNGKWDPRQPISRYTFNTSFGASFGPDFVLLLDDPKYMEFQRCIRWTLSNLIYVIIFPLFSDIANRIFVQVSGFPKS